jgi:hypothetical protein
MDPYDIGQALIACLNKWGNQSLDTGYFERIFLRRARAAKTRADEPGQKPGNGKERKQKLKL